MADDHSNRLMYDHAARFGRGYARTLIEGGCDRRAALEAIDAGHAINGENTDKTGEINGAAR